MDDRLREHILSTYLTLRYGVAVIGAILPLLVYGMGLFRGIPLQNSISAYYWATANCNDKTGTQSRVAPKDAHAEPCRPPSTPDTAPSRNWFVGSLFAVAVFLYLYKGFSVAENLALNLAAILAVGVAVFPMEWNCGDACGKYSVHGFCAVAMFACLAYVVWFRAKDTLPLIPEKGKPSQATYRQLYKIIGAVMLLSPVTAFVLNSVIGAETTYVFFIEAAGIVAFSLYWWVKSSELKRSAATIRALQGQVKAPASPAGGPVTPVGSDDNGSGQIGNSEDGRQ